MSDDVYTIDEVAARLKIHRNTVDRAIQRKEIRAVHIGRQVRISHAELERVIAEGTVAPSVAALPYPVPTGRKSSRR